MLEVKSLSKKYGEKTVFEDLELSAEAGEIIGLVGENGAGKSTLLKILATLSLPSSGEISLMNQTYRKNEKKLREYIAYVPQDIALFEELTVILLISVLIFGPKKIPEVARGLGEGLRAMKKATDDIKREIMTPVDEINPMKDIEETIQKTQEEIKDSITDIPDPQKEIEETLDDMVGPIKRK